MIKKIVVLFKTHLDVGFTNLAAEIVKKYNEIYIPQAIRIGEEIQEREIKEGFVWTTGSWLIWQYLENSDQQERSKMEQAIRNGCISWHGLPATMHSELMSADLFAYGLSLSKELDQRFGIHTIGAKYTDVPGHTIGIVPLLRKADIRFLHIGVNAASAAPCVPDFFRWRAESGEEIIVMYNKGGYGEFSVIPGTETAVYFAHTLDNMGPQSVQEILDIYAQLHCEYPDAEISAGSLNDVAEVIIQTAESLPVVTSEIGDSWIHGVASDPQKVSRFRSLLRFAKELDPGVRNALYSELLLIPEHTWGLDEKTFLHDHYHYAKEEFYQVRGEDNYRMMESSWQEQRNYLSAGIQKLIGEDRRRAEETVKSSAAEYPALSAYTKAKDRRIEKNGWKISFDEKGSVVALEKDGRVFADADHKLCDFKYEVFSEKEVKEFIGRYTKKVFDWALEDFGKIGLSNDIDGYRDYHLRCNGIYENAQEILLCLSPEQQATEKYGCPARFILKILPEEKKITFDFAWFDKPALRIPEALWLGFCFTKPLTSVKKMDTEIDPLNVVSKGNREMHCSDGLLRFDDLSLETLDAPLFAVERPSGYGFYDRIPDTKKGVWFNLFNNLWGTNFTMWYEDDARFRYELRI